ncbi:LdpA C-terminal domain-containing domain [Oscillatoria sp. FACHB-1406]|uniref:circadian clock protein LdpA n=1 Tax=Oscillatoria sp. FACHB-1406 TaxID=2692846 RepID=UPI001687593F|nr:4Fe-4S ferredoxin [Oscillatoria sp. FACHB-1406]
MDKHRSPIHSLTTNRWFKLICGASYQDLPAIRSLTLAYTLAGADCIDVAADPAVIAAVRQALAVATGWLEEAEARGFQPSPSPWLMVSLNDGEDPHFRKAEFDPTQCPSDCPRPCEIICPAEAIRFGGAVEGVIDSRCYGCGRCLPVCPEQLISARARVFAPEAIASSIMSLEIDAIEIHTQVGRRDDFKRLWAAIHPWLHRLQAIAISCPDSPDIIPYLTSLYDLMSPLPCRLIWQTDGRPMSGDIGKGTTRAAVKLARKVLAANLPGLVQLAGGTNQHTVAKLQAEGLRSLDATSIPSVVGVAYGSYARSLLLPVLHQLEQQSLQTQTLPHLENFPALLWQAVAIADSLVSPVKGNQSNFNTAISRGILA